MACEACNEEEIVCPQQSEQNAAKETIKTRPRASLALRHHHESNQILLDLDKSDLRNYSAYRGNHLDELKQCARSLNNGIRTHYADYIHNVGRNIYPLIIATDYEPDGPVGVGNTLTLYEASGKVTKVSPALNSNYELYKSCSHTFMGLAVELGPYLVNAGLLCCEGDRSTVNGKGVMNGNHCTDFPLRNSKHDVSWKSSLCEYLQYVRTYRHALMNATEVEALVDEEYSEKKESDAATSYGLPPADMRKTMIDMLSSVIDFCESCIDTGMIDLLAWEELNQANFPRIKKCMKAATLAQADACVKQIVEWRDMLGKEAWRDLYVVIPTVWAVAGENPRTEMFKQLMDKDRVDTHLITSEYPRDQNDARTLLGRVVGDRAIGRFVFGVESLEKQIKTMGLSSKVDVVLDDALPAIWNACEQHGCPIRHHG